MEEPALMPMMVLPSFSMVSAGAAVAIAVSAALLGCAHKEGMSVSGGDVLSASAADLRPEAAPGEKATLRLGEKSPTEFDVDLITAQDGSNVTLTIASGGETLERETYESSPSAYRIAVAGVDAFSPGIDLVRYPARDGAAWDWTGKVVYAGITRDAHARITTTKDGGDLRSEVKLFVTADPGRPDLQRRLAFWFRKDHGVVRRVFGDVSYRWPQGEAWKAEAWRP